MPQEVILGLLIDGEAKRDAIHVAVAPAIADDFMAPGAEVGFVAPGDCSRVGFAEKKIGIVDPFLKKAVRPGERFWILLFQKSVTSLRHAWTHPAFPDEAVSESVAMASDPGDGEKAKRRIETIAAALDLTYTALMRGAKEWLDYEEYQTEIGREHWRDTFPIYCEEFWKCYEIVTGTPVPEEKRQQFFSCSC
jgi:hypothetical protein